MRMMPVIVPTAGQRVGVVDGPGQSPCGNAGTVLCQVQDRWGTHAVVLMDTGKTSICNGLNTGPGIGWHTLTRTDPEADSSVLRSTRARAGKRV
jgi:hypothetical protein